MEQISSTHMIRSFFAIELNSTVLLQCEELIYALEKIPALERIKWVSTSNLHITLHFLGNINPHQIDNLIQCVQQETKAQPPFMVHVDKVTPFPYHRNTHSLILTVQPNPALMKLASAIQAGCMLCGLPGDTRSYTPHLTLGSCGKKQLVLGDRIILPKPDISFKVEHFSLLQSHLTQMGATYTPLHRIALLKSEGKHK
jgi:RNA 2',3'-cyclic 3'-phosphodiesterase